MKLHVFTTGGTIDKVYFDANSQFEVGDPMVSFILHEAGVAFDVECTALFRKDSLDITDDDRRMIHDAVASSPAEFILITHGTDTMTETGKCLMDIPGKTIVLTGSLSPARFQESDAAFNIGCAIGAMHCAQHGVYIAMNGQVFAADRVVKNVARQKFEAIPDQAH